MANTDAFCQTVAVTMQTGGPKYRGLDKLAELITIRQKLGMPDHRLDELECELCDSGDYTVHHLATVPAVVNCHRLAAANRRSIGPEDHRYDHGQAS